MKQNDASLEPLPQLKKNCHLHETAMRAIQRGHARSWSEAYGVGLYLSHPKGREAGKVWLDHYGLDRSQFSVLLMIREDRRNGGDIGV
jgi:hypothetical protein